MAARSESELKQKAAGKQGEMLKARHEALSAYLRQAQQAISDAPQSDGSKGPTYEQRQAQFLEDKLAANKMLLDMYEGSAGQDSQKAFYEAATKSWTEGIPDVVGKIEQEIKGTFVLGDQVVSSFSCNSLFRADVQSLGDLHLISWLSRLVDIAGGDRTASGIRAIENTIAGFKIGPKLEAFWAAWIERESYQKVCVQAFPPSLSGSKINETDTLPAYTSLRRPIVRDAQAGTVKLSNTRFRDEKITQHVHSQHTLYSSNEDQDDGCLPRQGEAISSCRYRPTCDLSRPRHSQRLLSPDPIYQPFHPTRPPHPRHAAP